ncbi:MAG: aspartate/glutamate racemase family protein [Patescibacteria group bacterium]|nr:aspartate/glutamate racemase family protein [Patescibacteria group bacterium]
MRIGILGGMGPLAGVELQRRIIEYTPADRDQDHLEVVCFTNPHISDRSISLANDDGKKFAEQLDASLKVLARARVDCIAIPCNTAHARFEELQRGVSVPIVNMIGLVLEALEMNPELTPIGLLATDGTIKGGMYQSNPRGVGRWFIPGAEIQAGVMRAVSLIKGGRGGEALPLLRSAVRDVAGRGAKTVVLGCTEISLYRKEIGAMGCRLIDPLDLLARKLVALATTGASTILSDALVKSRPSLEG